MPIVEHRTEIIKAARLGVQMNQLIGYTEDSNRSDFLHKPRGHFPFSTDCSGFCTWCFWEAGAPDPNGHFYEYVGDTITIAKAAYKEVSWISKQAGDFCILGLELPLSSQHMVILDDVHDVFDPLVISHGSAAGPVVIRLSTDHRSKRFFTYHTTTGTK